MADRCSRTECDAPAAARVTFDALEAFVWIDPVEGGGPHDVGARGAGMLCAVHADALVAPRGWTVQDRRGRAPRLWSDRPASPFATEPASPFATEPASPFGTEPAVTAEADAGGRRAASTVAETTPSAPAADEPLLPFEPASSAEPTADIDRLLESARGPMLARAFNAARDRQAG